MSTGFFEKKSSYMNWLISFLISKNAENCNLSSASYKKRLKADFGILFSNNLVEILWEYTHQVSTKFIKNSVAKEYWAKNRFLSCGNYTLNQLAWNSGYFLPLSILNNHQFTRPRLSYLSLKLSTHIQFLDWTAFCFRRNANYAFIWPIFVRTAPCIIVSHPGVSVRSSSPAPQKRCISWYSLNMSEMTRNFRTIF